MHLLAIFFYNVRGKKIPQSFGGSGRWELDNRSGQDD